MVGGGQTGAERAEPDRPGDSGTSAGWPRRFAPLDDSPSANDFYRPTYLRFFQGLPSGTRERYVTAQTLASDGISMDTLRRLYQLNYESYLREGRSPVMMLPGRDVVDAASRHGSVALWCERDWGGRERHTARYVVLATAGEPPRCRSRPVCASSSTRTPPANRWWSRTTRCAGSTERNTGSSCRTEAG